MLMNKSFFSPNLNLIRISISSVFRRNFAQTSVSRRTMQKSAVIMDLDGTLLDTESVVDEVLQDFLAKQYGKTWDGRGNDKRLGKRPLEACASIIEDYELPCTPEHLMAETSPLFENMWSRTKPLPGAVRLIEHLTSHDVPIALASNSPRNNVEAKLSYQQGWKDSFKVAGDEVYEGKPAPEIYLKAAKQLQADPQSCLVIEDSLSKETIVMMENLASKTIPVRDEDGEIDEEEYVLLEFESDLSQLNFPPNSPYTLSGLDTMNPTLAIGDLKLIGEYEETVGSCLIFSEEEQAVVHEETGPSDANLFAGKYIEDSSQAPERKIRSVCQLQKVLKFKILGDEKMEVVKKAKEGENDVPSSNYNT